MDAFEASFSKFLKPGDDEATGLVAFRLQPIAVSVGSSEPLADDPLGTHGTHMLEQAISVADDVIDVDDPLATRVVEHVLQQRFALLDRATTQVVAIRVNQVECEESEPIRMVPSKGIVERIDVRNTALVRDGDLTIEDKLSPTVLDVAEGSPE